jgi:hypothetical protein
MPGVSKRMQCTQTNNIADVACSSTLIGLNVIAMIASWIHGVMVMFIHERGANFTKQITSE